MTTNQRTVLDLARKGLRPKQISDLTGIKYPTVGHICREAGYRYLPNQGNTRYFKSIDTYSKAYIVGFIAADGCIQDNGNGSVGLTIQINTEDKSVLDFIRSQIGCENTVKPVANRTMHRFQIFNKDLVNDLAKIGIGMRKSNTIGNIITNIPVKYRDAFVIGYTDGDGSIFHSHYWKSAKRPEISIRGTFDLLQGIKDHLNLRTGPRQYEYACLTISNKRDQRRFFNCYQHLNFYLQRKYAVLASYMA